MQDAIYLIHQMSTFLIIVERTCVQRWIWYLAELGNSNWVLETKFWGTALFIYFFTKFVIGMGGMQNTFTLISPKVWLIA